MKKTLLSLVCAAAMAVSFSSCAIVSTSAGAACLYTNVQDAGAVTSNTVGSKVGTGKATNILGLIVTGDASINTAAKAAGIRKISHVDYNKSSVLGIFSVSQIYVYGE